MKILEILLEDQEAKGTYAAVSFDDDTAALLEKYIKDNNIPNGTPVDKLHCTLLYSRKPCPNYKPVGDIDPPWVGNPTGLDVWESRGKTDDQAPSRCLVLEFECDELHDRHKQLMDEHDATYDFPEYKTHITLSYDIGDIDEADLPDVTKAVDKITIVEEYGEELDTSWKDKINK